MIAYINFGARPTTPFLDLLFSEDFLATTLPTNLRFEKIKLSVFRQSYSTSLTKYKMETAHIRKAE